jgi:anti-sigma B factor antagonist
MTVAPEPFSITSSTHGACEIVELAGELDMVNAPTLSDTLDTLADTDRSVIVDLSELSFIDSSGIHAILRGRPEQRIAALVCPPGNIHRVLSVAKIDRVLPLYDTLDQALAALA